jgi:serine/threonine-protein kinase
MAQVYEAKVRDKYRRKSSPRRVALKVAKPEYQASLTAEADFLKLFDHPNIVSIYPLPRFEDRYAARYKIRTGEWVWYYAMEMVGGGSLERRLQRTTTITHLLREPEGERPLGLLEVLGISRQIAAALEHIHAQHIVNLDVKPGNILFRRRRFRYLRGSVPQAVMCDFGISRDMRFPRFGLLGVATPEYVSPEHAAEFDGQPQSLDGRSDIFSLGVVMYEMLTGFLPFEDMDELVDRFHQPAPPSHIRPSVPSELDEVVMKALEKNPNLRYQSASEMRKALKRVPKPVDWPAAARRTFVGLALAACGVFGCVMGDIVDLITDTPTPVPDVDPPAVTPSPTETVVPSPTMTDSTVSPTETESSGDPTSTPRPTSTPTPTPIPPTLTPTEDSGG